MLWVPSASALVAHWALRVLPAPVSATAPQPPIELAPSLKFTVPPGALPLTVAVNVTEAAKTAGLAELESVVVLGAWLTCCDSGVLGDAVLLESPPYLAMTEWVPRLSALVGHCAE